ncbi:MAG TPA: DUF4143 domain-containing protein [Methanocorpusculum sp.]|nr:DUF4143 domain-containing protein [Methanocorpusculum sp.]
MLRPKGYKSRLIDKKIAEYLSIFGAVCIEGPKWCGKTWSSLNQSDSVFYLADPTGNFSNREKVKIDPKFALDGPYPHLIDEWQEVPGIWDAVRFAVDQNGKKGLFLLTGSATPHRKGVSHSGVGKIATIKMQTMSLYESGNSSGKISLQDLFSGNISPTDTGAVDLKKLIELCVRGGWPQNISLSPEQAGVLSKEYLQTVIENDIFELDGINHDKRKMTALLHSLGRNESTTVTNATLKRDMQTYSDTTIEIPTLLTYLDLFTRLFLIYEQPSFNPHLRSSRRILKTPKRHFIDPSLAVAALQATPQMLFDDLETFGFIFEALCEHDLQIYAESLGGTLYHYRDDRGNEIDAVIELPDGRWGAFEIKLGAHQIDNAAANLLKIQKIIEKESGKSPALLCVICGLTDIAYRRDDGVCVVPITALKD